MRMIRLGDNETPHDTHVLFISAGSLLSKVGRHRSFNVWFFCILKLVLLPGNQLDSD